MVNYIRRFLLLILLALNFKVFAFERSSIESYSPALMNKSSKKYKNNLTLKVKSNEITEPSRIYTPDFYDKNELKDVFEAYSVVRNKIENPIEIKNENLVKNMEMSVSPHFKSTATTSFTNTSFMFSVEFKAIFL